MASWLSSLPSPGVSPRPAARSTPFSARQKSCGDQGLILRARLAWLDVAGDTDTDLAMAEIDAAAAEAVDYFESTGNDEGLAHAYSARRKKLNIGARREPMMEICEKVMYHSSRCGDHFIWSRRRGPFATPVMFYGPHPADEMLELVRRDALFR